MDILHEIAEKTRQRIEAEKKELPPEEGNGARRSLRGCTCRAHRRAAP